MEVKAVKEIKVVTVVGANGTMGASVAGVFAANGKCKVYMVARKKEAAVDAQAKTAATYKDDPSVGERLIAKTYEDLAEVLPQSDFVFESVAEDTQLKKDINARIAQYIRPDCIVGTGTSGLSIEELSQTLPESVRKYYTGTHFFNPPNILTFCEIIPIAGTDPEFVKEYKVYLEEVLKRAVVIVKDEAGFLGNRIGFQFMNEAMQYAEKYKAEGGIDYIDAIMGSFSGRSMAPIVTVDFVALDVHKAIVDNILEKTKDYANDTFVLPSWVQAQVDKGELGRKKGKGLYQTIKNEDGSRKTLVYDIATGQFRDVKKYDLPFAKKMNEALAGGDHAAAFAALKADDSKEGKLCLELLLKHLLYALFTASEVAEKAGDADISNCTGFAWAPALGLVQALGGAGEVKKLMKERLDAAMLAKVDLDKLIVDLPPVYDYKKYVRASK